MHVCWHAITDIPNKRANANPVDPTLRLEAAAEVHDSCTFSMHVDPAVGLARMHDPQLSTATNRPVGSTGTSSRSSYREIARENRTHLQAFIIPGQLRYYGWNR